MTTLHMPKGLVRYSNQDSIGKKAASIWRPRLIIYPLALTLRFAVHLSSGDEERFRRQNT